MYVIIDAGHNEYIAGKRSFDESLLEYEFNYDVAQKIKKHLDTYGITSEVLQIKTASATDDVNLRVKYANEKKPDIYVSIHANAYGTDWNTANGWEIYCYQPNIASSKSYKLAQCIHDESIPFLGLKDRGIKDGGHLGVVARTTMPAVLIEHGFYTNKTEVELLKTQAFREKCALADARGILKYFGIAEAKSEYEIVKERFGFSTDTMTYLSNYRYSEDLLHRLATKE